MCVADVVVTSRFSQRLPWRVFDDQKSVNGMYAYGQYVCKDVYKTKDRNPCRVLCPASFSVALVSILNSRQGGRRTAFMTEDKKKRKKEGLGGDSKGSTWCCTALVKTNLHTSCPIAMFCHLALPQTVDQDCSFTSSTDVKQRRNTSTFALHPYCPIAMVLASCPPVPFKVRLTPQRGEGV